MRSESSVRDDNRGQASGRNIAAGEAVEHELDAFISRRHEQRLKSEPECELEAAWKTSERRQEAARRREARAGWYGWHALTGRNSTRDCRGSMRPPRRG